MELREEDNKNQEDDASPLSAQEEDLSDPDLQDDESGEELPQQPLQNANTHLSNNAAAQSANALTHLNNFMVQSNPHFLAHLKERVEMDAMNSKMEALQAAAMTNGFSLPLPFLQLQSYCPPPMQNNHVQTVQNNHVQPNAGVATGGPTPGTSSSSSPHGSESPQGSVRNGALEPREGPSHSQNSNPPPANNPPPSNNQQQTSWSFEEQFKQLYELSDDPRRKEFLDDLFNFMQKRGTPINRLPIMAKSVLDLYELYNLVIARGGLVDVINKKLWQEIIKGLHLPSSITSAAFTLRTQYMKYLYYYECDKKQLSTEDELKAAIDGNRREGRRSSYGSFATNNSDIVQRNAHPQNQIALQSQINPLSMVAVTTGGHHGQLVNGNASHTHLPHHLPHPVPHPLSQANPEFEQRMAEYLKLLNKEGMARHAAETITPSMMHQHPGLTPPHQRSPMQPSPSPEPQREALDLGLRSSAASSPARVNTPSSGVSTRKRDTDFADSDLPPTKRVQTDEEYPEKPSTSASTHIKIASRGDSKKKEGSLVVSIDLNGVMYEGVLFAQPDTSAPSTSNATSSSRNMLS